MIYLNFIVQDNIFKFYYTRHLKFEILKSGQISYNDIFKFYCIRYLKFEILIMSNIKSCRSVT